MTYEVEHLAPGLLGNFLIALSFAGSLLATLSYFFAEKKRNTTEEKVWEKLADWSYRISSWSAVSFILVMFYLLTSGFYEYDYIWEQSNSKMNFKYILVAFWGGQEGSFMLWIFFHVLLGLIIKKKAGEWKFPVMTMFALVQAFLVSMLLGIYVFDFRLGTNPFALQRDVVDGYGSLWRQIPDYLTLDPRFQDGKGLNPLLQNYWMIIHPPTLFLGFALTLIPFAYAIAGLWRRKFSEWMKPALPWTFLGISVLGIGILMGGAWAYESLSFGGFWAWDPVENASLVPWLTLVGAGHLMLINRNHQKSVYSTLFFSLISFILILYSTFLTRSGVLGDTSVHSFTGEGMLGQLLIYMVFFVWLSVHMLILEKRPRIVFGIVTVVLLIMSFSVDLGGVLIEDGEFILTWKGLLVLVSLTVLILFLINNYIRYFPKADKEEELWSREFWLFIGSMVLLISALHISFNTSIPVINDLFNTNITLVETETRNAFYNGWQTPFAIIISLLVAVSQFFKYKNTELNKDFGKKFFPPLIISIIIALVLGYLLSLSSVPYNILLFTSIYSVAGNLTYWIKILKGKIKNAGASIAHIGFGLILLGALISQNKQQVISSNYTGYKLDLLSKDYSNQTDIQLFRGDTVAMGKYFVSFTDKFKEGYNLLYTIQYFDQEKARYKKDDLINYQGLIYSCKEDHTARQEFLTTTDKWEVIPQPTREQYFSARPWLPVMAGKKLFDLHPFVQLNDMSNVAEPGTKHFLTHDIFTHIRYADLAEPDSTKRGMEPFVMKGEIGDTLATAGFLVILNGVTPLNDSLKVASGLDSSAIAAFVNMKVYDLWDTQLKFPIDLRPVFVVSNRIESEEVWSDELDLGISIKNLKPKQGNSGSGLPYETAEVELAVKTREFIVLHAIVFPFINILWIGAIIMGIGTLMAALERWKK